ncbi:MAG: hypothetical protein ABI439_11360 [Rhodospirillales bacterium]
MRTRSKSNWLTDTAVAAAAVVAIMATSGTLRAMPLTPDVGCQVQQGGNGLRVAVLRPDLTTVWFERDSSTLSATGAQNLQAAIRAHQPGSVLEFQVMGPERPNAPSDHVAIDRVTTIATVTALSGVPADEVAIQPAEQKMGCAN